MLSEALIHKSVAQTCTSDSRRRNIEDEARPHPRSSTRIPARRSSAVASHSVSQSEFAPPLALATTHSGSYCEARGKRLVVHVIRVHISSGMCCRHRTRATLTTGLQDFFAAHSFKNASTFVGSWWSPCSSLPVSWMVNAFPSASRMTMAGRPRPAGFPYFLLMSPL
jgi:hypothetical protein